MKPAMLVLAFQLLAGSVALSARAQADPAQTAESAFAEGKALVETNCADCTGATAEALTKGLEEIQRAVDLGYADRPAAYRLLTAGYGALAYAFAWPDTAEHRHAQEAQREGYRRWIEADPMSGEALYGYAFALEDPAARRATLERLVQADPGHLWGQVSLAQAEIGSGAVANGLARMQQAFDLAEGADKREFGERLIEAYDSQGRATDAQAVRDRLAEMSSGP